MEFSRILSTFFRFFIILGARVLGAPYFWNFEPTKIEATYTLAYFYGGFSMLWEPKLGCTFTSTLLAATEGTELLSYTFFWGGYAKLRAIKLLTFY